MGEERKEETGNKKDIKAQETVKFWEHFVVKAAVVLGKVLGHSTNW